MWRHDNLVIIIIFSHKSFIITLLVFDHHDWYYIVWKHSLHADIVTQAFLKQIVNSGCRINNYLHIFRHLGYERVYQPLYKVADTPYHIQGEDLSSDKKRIIQYHPRKDRVFPYIDSMLSDIEITLVLCPVIGGLVSGWCRIFRVWALDIGCTLQLQFKSKWYWLILIKFRWKYCLTATLAECFDTILIASNHFL